MRYEDELYVYTTTGSGYDINGNPLEPVTTESFFSKCFISFNSSAQKVILHDGREYQYTYYIIAPLKKDLYDSLPKEGSTVRIVKGDGTIDCVKEVKGFVTYKKRYLKIWL